jgi:pimeloyl-ACP methyl ester carboxylesterase
VVGVGHSFGSAITQGITAMDPSTLDAAILTGFSTNQTAIAPFITSLNLEIASLNQPYRFSTLSNGYLVAATTTSTQYGFLRSPNFSPLIASAATAQKGSVTFGELFTQAAIASVASNYTKPVAIVNGDADLPFCFGNCSFPVDLAKRAIGELYPASTMRDTFLLPSVGHGVNLHYTADQAFAFIHQFLKRTL